MRSGYFILLVLALFGCHKPKQAKKDGGGIPNPEISDNYEALASLANYKAWGVYNVHDPSCLKIGDWYYMYTTDAYYQDGQRKQGEKVRDANGALVPEGYIQIRRSKDLVQWEYVGWVFEQIPAAAVQHIHAQTGGEGAENMWAPYIIEYNDELRLYYSVSAFGKNSSYIGMAVSSDPASGWVDKGCVVKTTLESKMNAIDPTISTNYTTGQQYMIYGSYFDGLYCMELQPENGLAFVEGDQGKCVARRAQGKDRIIEAPEVMYNPETQYYYLFVSYEPLMVTYNIRVGRSKYPDGPYLDFFGNDMAEAENNYPRLTGAYRFDNHPGWAGTAHCGVTRGEDGFYLMHQGRLQPDNMQMVLHCRKIYWTSDGWPVVSPERYAGSDETPVVESEVVGSWELICMDKEDSGRALWQGQVLWGEGNLREEEIHTSTKITLSANHQLQEGGQWQLNGDRLIMKLGEESLELIVDRAWDWENNQPTIIFTGLNSKGLAVWGKKGAEII
ncbi:arabinan endo-1,5-alpha-L-arabinosidase [Persicobacter diffluens]|uniref:Endo-arabinase n=1 Tax=Persicobacter diffluens TaxID=981 RepID=A0AAN4W501_9BACT|nr:endo-arabinase [Persicobacter diffluens]